MKSLNNRSVKRQKEVKRKRDYDEVDADDEKLQDKHVKLDDVLPKNDHNLGLSEENADVTTGFLDEYCQILLKDTAGDHEQDDVVLNDELLTERTQDIFNEKSAIVIKLKNWVLKNNLNIKNKVVDELLVILREEGYLDLPTTTEELLEQDNEITEFPKNNSKKNDHFRQEFDDHSIWIKKEGDDDLWKTEDHSVSQDDKIQEENPLNCSEFTDDDFANLEPSSDAEKVKSTSSESYKVLKKSSLYLAVRDELKKMDERWTRQLESTKRSLLYDMVRKYEDLKSRIGASNRPYGTNFTDDKEILGIKLPFKDVDSFSEFDLTIADNPEKEIAMKSLMTTLCFGASTLSNSIGSILSAFLTKDLQMQYSACGKKIRGIKKRNFGDTNTFTYAKDVLREKHGTSDAEIISRTSRWFTGAGDRDGGRKERRNEMKNKI